MSVLYLIIGIILFIGLVVVHEAGHALVAWLNKVKVEEFGVGFPPRILSKKLKNGTELSINWLPLGGFVRLRGEHDSATGEGTYGGASLWAKTKILMAGVAMNWLMAILIFTILALVGMPQVLPDQFTVSGDTVYSQRKVVAVEVIKNSPAYKSGIKAGDIIEKLDNVDVQSADNLTQLTKAQAGQKVLVVVGRESKTLKVAMTLNSQRITGQGYSGIGPGEEIARRSTWSAPIVGIGVTVQFTVATIGGLGQTIGHLFKSQFAEAGQNVAGPIGIFTILQHSSEVGFTSVLFLIGIISLTLAVMNSLPIPALDGGRLFVTVLFRAFGQKFTKEREEKVQTVGFMILMSLIILVTIVDIGKLFGN